MMAIPQQSFIFGGNTGETPESLKRKRQIAEALAVRTLSNAPKNVGEGLSAIGQALAYRKMMGKVAADEKTGQASGAEAFSPIAGALAGFPDAPGAGGASGGGVDSVPAGDAPANWENIQRGIFKGESGGDYDALFGFSNRPGKQFANAKLTDMTVDQALAFADPSGPYGQFVKGQIGRVATPMGAYQVVGTTLRGAKNGLGLKGNEIMSPQMQDRIGQWILANQGTGAWEGYKGPIAAPPGAQATEAMATGQPVPPAPTQVASLDPSIGMITPAPSSTVNPHQAGQPVADDPKTQRIMDTMSNPQSMTGGAPMPMQPSHSENIAAALQMPAPQTGQAAPQGVDLDKLSVMAGGNAGVIKPGQGGPTIAQLLAASSNPWAMKQHGPIIQALLGQKMEEQDPSHKLDMRYKQAQLDNLLHPQTKPTDDMREYEFAKSQGYEGSFLDFQLAQKKAAANSTIINNGTNSNKFVEESDKAAAKRMDEIVTAGQTAPQVMADMQQLIDLGAQIGTGKGAQLMAALGPYAQALGVNIEDLPEAQAYEAITSRLAPQMRATGSGSSSDRDVSMFLQSLPNLRNTQGGNEIIANTMKAVAQNKINAADIASKAQRGEISWQEADKQIRSLPNPYELFKEFQKETKKGGSGTTSGGLKWSIEP